MVNLPSCVSILPAFLLFVCGPGLLAQDTFPVDTTLLLSEVAVVGRRNESAAAVPYRVELLSRAQIDELQPASLADALSAVGGVYVQKSQLGGGSPVLRGFEANRVLLVVDGMRLNNAIYRGGHLQNAITVDPDALERVEVIYGPGALAYGSDAIGGVIHLRTEELDFREPVGKWSGRIGGRFASAANSAITSASLAYGSPRFAARTTVSLARYGDLRAGGNRPEAYQNFGLRNRYVARVDGEDVEVVNPNPNVQINSGYRQLNVQQRLGYRFSDVKTLQLNLQFSTTDDVPRYDALTETTAGRLRWARWDYGPQTRARVSLDYTDFSSRKFFDFWSVQLGSQFTEEDRLLRRFGDPVLEESLVDVTTVGLRFEFSKELSKRNLLRYGGEGRVENITSVSNFEPRYPAGGNGLRSVGAYVDYAREFTDVWTLRGGLRYGGQRLQSTFENTGEIEWPASYLAGITNRTAALTGAVSLQYARRGKRLRLVAGQAYRAPNLDDFTKFRERNGRVQVPNPDLAPERSATLELNGEWKFEDEKISLAGAVYHTFLTDAVVRRDGRLPGGATSFVSRGDTLLVQTNVNAESASVYGFDLSLEYAINGYWSATTNFHFLRGRRNQGTPDGQTISLPQDHVPPAYGGGQLRYGRTNWSARLLVSYQFAKPLAEYAVGTITGNAVSGYQLDRSGTSDNLELTPDRAGTPAWWTANLYFKYRFRNWRFRLKGENLLDRHYRTFASGISAPGIDLGMGVERIF